MSLPARLRALPASTPPLEGERVERAEPRAGEYWRYVGPEHTPPDERYRPGDILLVAGTEFADGRLHNVDVRGHPRATRRDSVWSMLLADFLEHFEPVAPAEAEAVRAREVEGVLADIERLRRKLALPADLDADTRLLAAPQGRLPGPAGGSAVPATAGEAIAARTALEAAGSRAVAEAGRIEKGVEAIGAKSKELQAYTEEKAAAAMAAVAGVLALARHYASGAATLGLFAGQGVEAVRLCEGQPAPPGPLHVMQRLLFMDEEYVVHLSNGGADWRNLDDFGAAIAADADLLARLLPFERCVVAMRIRRHDRDYMSAALERVGRFTSVLRAALGLVEAAKAAAAENEANRETFLLVRNGRRVTRIHAELSTNGMERLFPTAADLKEHFERHHWRYNSKTRRSEDVVEEITLDSLDYASAVGALEQQKTHYRRLIVTLWGAHERDGEIFGAFYDPARHPSWLSVDFQREALKLVRDDEGLLGTGRPSFEEFRCAHNSNLQPGSRLLVNWKRALIRATAPAAFSASDGSSDYRILEPVEAFSIVRARTDERQTVVDCPCEGDHSWRNHHRTGKGGTKRRLNVRVEIGRAREDAYLVLDAISAADLDWYLTNRADRAEYFKYWDLFEAARRLLGEEERRDRPVIDAIAGEIAASGRWPEADHAKACIAGLRRWRAANAWRAPHLSDIAAIREFAWRELGSPEADSERKAAEAACTAEGRALLRIVGLGAKRFVYASASAEETHALRPASPLDGWVLRAAFDGRRLTASGRRWLRLPAAVASEAVLAETPAAEDWTARRVPALAREKVAAAVASLPGWRDTLGEMFAPLTFEAFRIEIKRWHGWRPRRGTVVWPEVFGALGMILRADDSRWERPVLATGLSVELCDLLLLRLPARDRAAAIDVMAETYEKQTYIRTRMARLLSGDNQPADWSACRKAAMPSVGWIAGREETGVRRLEPDERRDAAELLHPDAAAWLETIGLRLPRAQANAGSGARRRTAASLVKALGTIGIVLDPPSKKETVR